MGNYGAGLYGEGLYGQGGSSTPPAYGFWLTPAVLILLELALLLTAFTG